MQQLLKRQNVYISYCLLALEIMSTIYKSSVSMMLAFCFWRGNIL